ncbi:Hypothetical predicted protein [Lecanosticta acicola]|uniref:Potassium channel tetramerisation-type BTB domain-containing protein n=1 Tax=Lecanosticta acicola TaxID=111012 RepID=A0AAI8Z0J3_9PEZI|nr:Hypothetical predicted protein [Lecanosticta acicola]
MASLSKTSHAVQNENNGDGDRVEPPDRSARDTSPPSTSRPIQGQATAGHGDSGARRPMETFIGDLHTHRKNPQKSYHEPQGELLQGQRIQKPAKEEFHYPNTIGGSNNPGWSFSDNNRGNSSDGFVVSQQPTGAVPPTAAELESPEAARQAEEREARAMTATQEGLSPGENRPPAPATRSQSGPEIRDRDETATSHSAEATGFQAVRPALGVLDGPAAAPRRAATDPGQPMLLPARKVFPIQIGDKLFGLSGASISSDAPSYFSQFFEDQLRQAEGADSVRTLYIDRDPATFEDIALHLQGYHIEPRDGSHFTKLFADAQFYTLPRLTAQLFSSTIYIRIGDGEFRIPRGLFNNPGDSPNYFTLGFSFIFTTPEEVFPGLSERTLLRPPSILPPSLPNKSAKTFADLLHILKGYPVEIRNDEHRQELLRDARYYHLKGLEQRLIPHEISYNLPRKRSEILIRLEDVRQSGISFVADTGNAGQYPAAPSPASSTSSIASAAGWIYYQRPYVDSEAYGLILEVGGEENMYLSIKHGSTARMGRATFHRQTLQRIASLFSVVASQTNLPLAQPLDLIMLERGAGVASLPASPHDHGVSEERVKVRIGPDADVMLNGKSWILGDVVDDDESVMESEPSRAGGKRRRQDEGEDEGEEWVVRKSQWRLRVQRISSSGAPFHGAMNGMEVVLDAVKIAAFSNERARNASRGFLS